MVGIDDYQLKYGCSMVIDPSAASGAPLMLCVPWASPNAELPAVALRPDHMFCVHSGYPLDPRGMAGYYRADLIEQRDDGTRWISSGGRERLSALRGVRILAETPTSEP
jgi:hypothetical protein